MVQKTRGMETYQTLGGIMRIQNIIVIASIGLTVGVLAAFAPHVSATAKGRPPLLDSNMITIDKIPWRITSVWRDPLHHPISEYECLSEVIYFEGRNQGSIGMLAIGNVVNNRTRMKGFPRTICGVIRQRLRNGGYEFSYQAGDKKYSDKPDDMAAKALSEKIAIRILERQTTDPTDGAGYYLNIKTAKFPKFHKMLMAQNNMESITIKDHTFIRKRVNFIQYMQNRIAPARGNPD